MDPIAEQKVFSALDDMGIRYQTVHHAEAYRMEDCVEVVRSLDALSVKNFFLCPRNQNGFWLLMTRPDAKLKTKDISSQLGSSRLSFAPEDKLAELLHERPGSISPMGLIFDTERRVTPVIDEALLKEARLAFHPCVNTASLALSAEDFFDVFLKKLGYAYRTVQIHDFIASEEKTHE